MIMGKLPMPDEIQSPSVGDRAPLEAAQSRHVAALAKVEAISRAIDSQEAPWGRSRNCCEIATLQSPRRVSPRSIYLRRRRSSGEYPQAPGRGRRLGRRCKARRRIEKGLCRLADFVNISWQA